MTASRIRTKTALRDLYRERIAAGICVRCGALRDGDGTVCSPCAAKAKERRSTCGLAKAERRIARLEALIRSALHKDDKAAAKGKRALCDSVRAAFEREVGHE